MIKNRWGRIIGLGGMSSNLGMAKRLHVLAAKAGLVGMIGGLATELAPHNITCNIVAPGQIETDRPKSAGPRPSAGMPLADQPAWSRGRDRRHDPLSLSARGGLHHWPDDACQRWGILRRLSPHRMWCVMSVAFHRPPHQVRDQTSINVLPTNQRAGKLFSARGLSGRGHVVVFLYERDHHSGLISSKAKDREKP